MFQEVSTITDLHNTSDQAEVELVSLVQDQIPQYTLRADAGHDYSQEDWLQVPVLPQDFNVDLTATQCNEVFKLLLLSGNRHSQMTETYNDIRAVTSLLEERERDLELAARIGQTLLIKNKAIVEQKDTLEEQLTKAMEEASQLKHEITQKENLLHMYTNDDSSATPSPSKEYRLISKPGPMAQVDLLHEKIKQLELDNENLKQEQTSLQAEAQNLDDKENCLIINTVSQLGSLHTELRNANEQITTITDELTRRNEEATRQQDEIDGLLMHILQLQKKYNSLTSEHEDLQHDLTYASISQKELSEAVFNLEYKYKEVLSILDETRQESRRVHSSSMLSDDGIEMAYDRIPFANSIAAELEVSDADISIPSPNLDETRPRPSRPIFDQKIVQTVKVANKRPGALIRHEEPIEEIVPEQVPAVKSKTAVRANRLQKVTLKRMGKPGKPGTNDLDEAIRKLSRIKFWSKQQQPHSVIEPFHSSTTKKSIRKCKSAPRLRIVKPIEGSITLQQWKNLAENKLPLFSLSEDYLSPAGIVVRSYQSTDTAIRGENIPTPSTDETDDDEDSFNDTGILFSAGSSTDSPALALHDKTTLHEEVNSTGAFKVTATPCKARSGIVKFSSTPIPCPATNSTRQANHQSDWGYLHGVSTPPLPTLYLTTPSTGSAPSCSTANPPGIRVGSSGTPSSRVKLELSVVKPSKSKSCSEGF